MRKRDYSKNIHMHQSPMQFASNLRRRANKGKIFAIKTISAFLIALIIIIWFFYFLFFHSYFDVKKVTVVDPGGVIDVQLEQIVKNVISEKKMIIFKKGNIHLLSKKEIERRIRAIVSLENIKIDKRWSSEVYIVAKKRNPIILLVKVPMGYGSVDPVYYQAGDVKREGDEPEIRNQEELETHSKESASLEVNESGAENEEEIEILNLNQDKILEYFYIDMIGVTIGKPFHNETSRDLELYPVVEWETDREVTVGQRVIKPEVVTRILALEKSLLPEVNTPAEKFLLSDVLVGEIHVVTEEGWRILFDSNADMQEQLRKLSLVLKEKIKEERAGIEYIDLRIDGRVYFK